MAGSWQNLVAAAKAASIEAPALRAVTLAQWALESGWGTSALATQHCNFAGLKWRPEMQGFAVPVDYIAHDGPDVYCAFDSESAFIAGYWRFIGRAPYVGWHNHMNSAVDYIQFIASRGYAGDPNYAQKVINLLDEATAILGDGGSIANGPMDEEDRPDRPVLDSHWDDLHDRIALPDFVTLGHVKHKFNGRRPNGLEGAIVHYDAGRTRPVSGAPSPTFGARNALESGAKSGYTYVAIARNGHILLPANMDWQQWGSHAGPSECPVTKRKGVSQYYVGFEINSPGLVYPTSDPDKFVPWFEAVRDEKGNVILDAKGHAKIKNAKGEIYTKAQLRHIKVRTGNIRPGFYVPYTAEQFQSLVQVLLWLKTEFRSSFRLDYVFGHDEVATPQGRKVDPGGALGAAAAGAIGPAMTMAELRKALLHEWAQMQ